MQTAIYPPPPALKVCPPSSRGKKKAVWPSQIYIKNWVCPLSMMRLPIQYQEGNWHFWSLPLIYTTTSPRGCSPRGQDNPLPKESLTKLPGPAVDPAGTARGGHWWPARRGWGGWAQTPPPKGRKRVVTTPYHLDMSDWPVIKAWPAPKLFGPRTIFFVYLDNIFEMFRFRPKMQNMSSTNGCQWQWGAYFILFIYLFFIF